MESIILLGGSELEFKQDINGLTVKMPSIKPNAIAPVFRITLKPDNRSTQPSKAVE